MQTKFGTNQCAVQGGPDANRTQRYSDAPLARTLMHEKPSDVFVVIGIYCT